MKIAETTLGQIVVAWLEKNGWDVYQEVGEIDIVALKGKIVWIIECKTSLSTKLCAQAFRRRGEAHHVSVAIPKTERFDEGHRWAMDRLEEAGIGVLEVNFSSKGLRQVRKPTLFRRADTTRLVSSLRPEHKTAAPAGTNKGGRWSPWRETCKKILEVVQASPGITLKDLLKDHGKFHYASRSSAKTTLTHWFLANKIPGITCLQEDKTLKLFPTGTPTTITFRFTKETNE